MKSTILKIVTTTLLMIMLSSTVHAEEWTGNIIGLLGIKSLDDKDWPQLDNQLELGVLFDLKQKSWPISIALDARISSDSNTVNLTETTASTFEFNLGVRKYFEFENSDFKPYINGGLALISAEIEKKTTSGNTVTTTTEDDNAVGSWFGGGVNLALTEEFSIGLDIRYSQGDVTIFNLNREAGGFHAGLTAGYVW